MTSQVKPRASSPAQPGSAAEPSAVAQWSISLLLGIIFGVGLTVSQMVNPAKVLGFLDITGEWDPSLALVMGAALLVATPAFAWGRRRSRSLLGFSLSLPSRKDIDRPLLLGATLFGVGWGLVGLCPGPALASVALAANQTAPFVLAMLLGFVGHELYSRRANKS